MIIELYDMTMFSFLRTTKLSSKGAIPFLRYHQQWFRVFMIFWEENSCKLNHWSHFHEKKNINAITDSQTCKHDNIMSK